MERKGTITRSTFCLESVAPLQIQPLHIFRIDVYTEPETAGVPFYMG